MSEEKQAEYIEALESEARTMAEMLQRMARRVGELTDQRNRYWREAVELRKAVNGKAQDR